jgi:hypothetical protein
MSDSKPAVLRIYQSSFERFDDGSARINLVSPIGGATTGFTTLSLSFEAADVEKIVAHLSGK